jgi:putative endonuclease
MRLAMRPSGGVESVILSRRSECDGVSKDLAPPIFRRRDSSGDAVQARRFYVYILASRSGVLYIGVPNHIPCRMYEHRYQLVPGILPANYKIYRLVALKRLIDRTKRLLRKGRLDGWMRQRKIAFIESLNPGLKELASNWIRD